MSYYIKGVIGRGEEVIELLKSKGGIDTQGCSGKDNNGYYYINKYKYICFTSNLSHIKMLEALCEELTLPEKKTWKPKFNVGDYVRDNIQSEVIGKITRIAEDESYIVHLIGYSPGGRVLEKDIIPWKPKRGETVLVRDDSKLVWREGIFSFTEPTANSNRPLYHVLGGNFFLRCAPFDENKLGKVTD